MTEADIYMTWINYYIFSYAMGYDYLSMPWCYVYPHVLNKYGQLTSKCSVWRLDLYQEIKNIRLRKILPPQNLYTFLFKLTCFTTCALNFDVKFYSVNIICLAWTIDINATLSSSCWRHDYDVTMEVYENTQQAICAKPADALVPYPSILQRSLFVS